MLLVGRTAAVLVLALGLFVPTGRAETSSERAGSILIFPKIVFDGERETVVQMSNTTNMEVYAHCFYTNAAPLCVGFGDCVAGTCNGRCEPQWQEIDFNIVLTSQQPTHWAVGTGRFQNPLDPPCNPITPNNDCDGAGLDPGRIPPVTLPFTGELRCIEVDPSDAPSSGNHLKGEGTILTRDGDASKYNAISIVGMPFVNNGDSTLCLGGEVSDECPSGAEYQGCSAQTVVNHFSEGGDSPLFGPTSEVSTEITIAPCRVDFERQIPSRFVVHFSVTNEFEQPLSAITTVDCWKSFFLDEVSNIFKVRTVGTRLLQTRMRSAEDAESGFVSVAEEHHTWDDASARVAFNVHEQGNREQGDLIILPGLQ